jgi:peptidoglycan/xylan/chitin deacetylase (PgdA/CDA1 family)
MSAVRRSKRDLTADTAALLGVTRALEALPHRPVLAVLNYHRVGDPARTPYDPDVFSATADGFDEQVRALKRRYAVVSLAEAAEIAEGRTRTRGVTVLLTFDDGYLDNYQNAFPVLRAHGVPATFFLITSQVGTATLPGWDRIAYAVRRTARDVVHLGPPYDVDLDLRAEGRLGATRQALRLFKSPRVTDPDHFVAALVEACEVGAPDASERLFMSWEEAAEMAKAGMDLGSHTHTHRILAKLPLADQVSELVTSRQVFRDRLGLDAVACAYPDGREYAFNLDTFTAMREAGYRLGFTFYGGLNFLPHDNPFNLARTAVAADMNLSRVRLRLALAGVGQDLGF